MRDLGIHWPVAPTEDELFWYGKSDRPGPGKFRALFKAVLLWIKLKVLDILDSLLLVSLSAHMCSMLAQRCVDCTILTVL